MTRLYKYQKVGVRRLGKLKLWAILADDMGLGKTIQVLTAIKKYLKKKGPIVVVCPATAKYTWEEQASEHARMNVVLLNGRRPSRLAVQAMARRDRVIYVLSYNVLTAWRDAILHADPALLVFDEAQRLKNPGAKWTRAAMQLKAPHMIFMGGTGGIEKTPLDLWPMLHMLRRSDWPPDFRRMTQKEQRSYTQFAETFTIMLDTPWGRKPAGVKNLEVLHGFLKKFLLIRRRTKDVLKDLPPVQRFRVPMEMTNRKEYDEAESSARSQMWEASRDFGGGNEVKVKAIAGNLMRKVVKLKLKSVQEWIEEFMEESEEKLICFGHHKFVVKGLQKKFGDAISVRIDGGVTGHKRRAAIDRFNNDPNCRLLFGNMKAAGEAWSCKSASNVAFMEVFPNPAVHNQCERRVRGVGRGVKGKPSRYFYLIAKETAEERLLVKVRKEQRTIDKAIDGGRTGGGIDLFEVVTGGRR